MKRLVKENIKLTILLIVSLGIIVIPVFFQGPFETDTATNVPADIPTPPRTPTELLEKKIDRKKLSESLAAQINTQQQSEPSASLKKAWSAMLKTFKQQAQADHLVTQLRAKGFRAYTEKSLGESQIIEVHVGPELDKQKILETVQQINDKFGIKGKIVPFEAIKEKIL